MTIIASKYKSISEIQARMTDVKAGLREIATTKGDFLLFKKLASELETLRRDECILKKECPHRYYYTVAWQDPPDYSSKDPGFHECILGLDHDGYHSDGVGFNWSR